MISFLILLLLVGVNGRTVDNLSGSDYRKNDDSVDVYDEAIPTEDREISKPVEGTDFYFHKYSGINLLPELRDRILYIPPLSIGHDSYKSPSKVSATSNGLKPIGKNVYGDYVEALDSEPHHKRLGAFSNSSEKHKLKWKSAYRSLANGGNFVENLSESHSRKYRHHLEQNKDVSGFDERAFFPESLKSPGIGDDPEGVFNGKGDLHGKKTVGNLNLENLASKLEMNSFTKPEDEKHKKDVKSDKEYSKGIQKLTKVGKEKEDDYEKEVKDKTEHLDGKYESNEKQNVKNKGDRLGKLNEVWKPLELSKTKGYDYPPTGSPSNEDDYEVFQVGDSLESDQSGDFEIPINEVSEAFQNLTPEDLNVAGNETLASIGNFNFRSLAFNPALQKFERCRTRNNEIGNCMHVQHCPVPNFASTLEELLNNACVVQGVFIGVCCPEFPVESVEINWGSAFKNSPQELTPEQVFECGQRTNVAIKAGTWPWMAPLVSAASGKTFCGGILINDLYVLTAAHCTTRVPQNQIVVRLGQQDFSDPQDITGEDFPVIKIKRHAQYNRRTKHNDIAILKLSRRVAIGQFQGPVCLPNKDDDLETVGNKAVLVGWRGVSGNVKARLLEESLSIIANEECEARQRFSVPESLLCTEARSEDRRTCNSDSGIPLVLKSHNIYQVIGILSWDRSECDPRFPTAYTKVSHYSEWIRNHST